MNYWQMLGIAPTNDRAAIRRAYAARIAAMCAADARRDFDELRAAYHAALSQVASAPGQMACEPGLSMSHFRPRKPWLLMTLLASAVAIALGTAWLSGPAETFGRLRQSMAALIPAPAPDAKPLDTAMRDLFRFTRPARPVQNSTEQQALSEELQALERSYYPQGAPTDVMLTVYYVVEPDGRIPLVRLQSSSYGNPAFEEAVLDVFRRLPYPADSRYGTSRFHYQHGWKARPAAAARKLRPLESVAPQLKQREADYAALLRRHRGVDAPPGSQAEVSFQVEPDGSVSAATLKSATFTKPTLQAELLDLVRSERFPANPEYAPASYTQQFVVPPLSSADARPVADVERRRGQQEAAFQRAFVRYFGENPATPGMALEAEYTVEPDGSVSAAHIRSSSFHHVQFEQAIVEALRGQRFQPRPGSVPPTNFLAQIGDPDSVKQLREAVQRTAKKTPEGVAQP